MNVKRIAAEVVAALPADADFDDLDEFLFERAQVEQGREDFEVGRVLSTREVLGETTGDVSTVLWAQSAAAAFREVNDGQDPPQDSLVAAVAEIVSSSIVRKNRASRFPRWATPRFESGMSGRRLFATGSCTTRRDQSIESYGSRTTRPATGT